MNLKKALVFIKSAVTRDDRHGLRAMHRLSENSPARAYVDGCNQASLIIANAKDRELHSSGTFVT